jgi:hypothetical protein
MIITKEELKKLVLKEVENFKNKNIDTSQFTPSTIGVAGNDATTMEEAIAPEVKQAVQELEKQLIELAKYFKTGPWGRLGMEKLKGIAGHIKSAYDIADHG